VKEPEWANCTEKQLWKYVAPHLAKNGIDTLLVGGAVVAIFSDGIYRSGDLDFVLLNYLNDKAVRSALSKRMTTEAELGQMVKALHLESTLARYFEAIAL
jgi:hypothetical protein